MTLYESPLVRRRTRLQVAAWMTALSSAAGQGASVHLWLAELVERLLARQQREVAS